jgi:large subunit ribosomal protein L24
MAESLIQVTNVSLVDPEDNKPCKVVYKYMEDGTKVRVSKRSGCVIPKPPDLADRKDFKSRSGYLEGDKDTKAADVTKVTYVPSLATFEEDIDELYPPAPLASTAI